MKHLFFVSVALGIFSGTSISVEAQTTVNLMRLNDGISTNLTSHSSEAVQANSETTVLVNANSIKKNTPKRITGKALDIESCSSLQFKYAQILNVEVESLGNNALYQFVEEWWATRYRYGGKTKEGIDCSAYAGTLLSSIYGISAPRTARDQYSVCTKLAREELVEGDLVFFNTRGGVSHVGVYLGNGYFTHASVGNGVTISHLDEKYYSRKFIGGGRLGVESPE